jgi:hypothetical protein
VALRYVTPPAVGNSDLVVGLLTSLHNGVQKILAANAAKDEETKRLQDAVNVAKAEIKRLQGTVG